MEKENRDVVPDRENPTGSRAAIIIAVLLVGRMQRNNSGGQALVKHSTPLSTVNAV